MPYDDTALFIGDDEEEQIPEELTTRAAQSLAVDPAVALARRDRDQALSEANILQGFTQIGTALGSNGQLDADPTVFDTVRKNANKRVDEVTKDVLSNRKLVSEYMKQKSAEARYKALDERDQRDYLQRERGIRATAINKEKPTEAQNKSAGFAKRMEEAEDDLNSLSAKGYDPADLKTAATAKFLPSFMQDENPKLQSQAELNFLNAVLRNESGATISPAELEKGAIQYFPRAGDTEAVKAQKKRNRQQQIESYKAASANAYSRIPSVPRDDKKNKQPKTVIQNGHTYTLNEATGKYE